MTTSVGTAGPRLTVLGDFALALDTGESVSITRTCQRLLALLAVNRGAVRRTTVWHRLWPETDSAHAGASLRSALWRLPKRNGQALVRASMTALSLSPTVSVDLWASELRAHHWIRSEGSSELVETDALLTQDLLPDWTDDWLHLNQESYRQLRLHALEQQSRRLLAHGHTTTALGSALTAVHGEPLRESAHRCVIEAHLHEGNHAEALRQYHSYRRLLAQELGIPPSPAIRHIVAPLLGRPLESRSIQHRARPRPGGPTTRGTR
jgi:DNA-binding SARP family transcriptional activator